MDKRKNLFEKKFIPEPNTGCWLWLASTCRDGYGAFWDGRLKLAHRFSYELYVGPIPDEALVLHRCDVPHCVNPAHLFLGTHADNSADKMAKGRQARGEKHGSRTHPERVPRGERHGNAKLNGKDVEAIRLSVGLSNRRLASIYKVDPTVIGDVRRGLAWRTPAV